MKLLISPSRLAAFLTAIALGGFLLLKRPDAVQPLDVQVPAGADYITHGRYIYTLANCDGCHSVREWTRFGAPVIPAWRGRGVEFPAELGLGRRVASANITTDPGTGLGAWSDGEKIRAIRDGISRDGRPLDPLMPYRRFRQMSDRDVYSLVAYLNTLPAVKHSVTKSRVSFFASLLGRDAPRPAGRVAEPNRGNRVEYGAYLATLAGCRDCHTQVARTLPAVPVRGRPKVPRSRHDGGERQYHSRSLHRHWPLVRARLAGSCLQVASMPNGIRRGSAVRT